MPSAGGRSGRVMRWNVDDPEDLRQLTLSGAIWKTPYADRAVKAIQSGAIPLAECQNVPPDILAALQREQGGGDEGVAATV